MVFDYTYRIRERDLDSFGHVNNATYLTIYEEARWEFLRANGITHHTLLKNAYGPVILDVHLEFKRELKNQDAITIRSEFPRMTSKIAKIEQQMLRKNEAGEDELCSRAVFTFAVFDLRTRKIIDPPEDWVRLGD